MSNLIDITASVSPVHGPGITVFATRPTGQRIKARFDSINEDFLFAQAADGTGSEITVTQAEIVQMQQAAHDESMASLDDDA